MKQIFNTVIALVFVMTTGCTSLPLSLHKNYNNSKKAPQTNNTQDSKLFCEALHKDHKLVSSKTAIANCIVTSGFTASLIEKNKKYKTILWWTLGTGAVVIVLGAMSVSLNLAFLKDLY